MSSRDANKDYLASSSNPNNASLSHRKPIPPLPPRWKPNPDPMSIEIPGLDTTASPQNQIEQMEQLITLKVLVD